MSQLTVGSKYTDRTGNIWTIAYVGKHYAIGSNAQGLECVLELNDGAPGQWLSAQPTTTIKHVDTLNITIN